MFLSRFVAGLYTATMQSPEGSDPSPAPELAPASRALSATYLRSVAFIIGCVAFPAFFLATGWVSLTTGFVLVPLVFWVLRVAKQADSPK